MAKRLSRSIKAAIVLRARGLCEYCLSSMEYSTHNFSIEHIIPSILGGDDSLENLALACQGCNGFKYIKTEAPDPAVPGQISPLFHPRFHNWDEHFTWSKDFLSIIGLTSTGRATIIALRLNRRTVMNLRFALIKLGKHPPKR